MPFPTKIQPLNSQTYGESIRNETVKPVLKSRIKRLFDRQFPSVLRISSAEKPPAGEQQYGNDVGTEFEPSSVCLAKMVQNFIEETNEKQSAPKCGRSRCNCFNGNSNDSSDDEFDFYSGFGDSIPVTLSADSLDMLKSLIPCASGVERNLLADTSKIVEKNKTCKRKDDLRKIVLDALLFLGYDSSICKSRWEKSPSYPAGEYEYIDVIVQGDRVLIDIDFRSEFEIARSTGGYKAILQSLPHIFVGRADRLQQIVSIVSEAARQSLKKKGMHIPPWRNTEYMWAKWLSPHARTSTAPLNDSVQGTDTPAAEENQTEAADTPSLATKETDFAEYMRAKWLSPHARTSTAPLNDNVQGTDTPVAEENQTEAADNPSLATAETDFGELELIFGVKTSSSEDHTAEISTWSPAVNSGGDKKLLAVASPWQPPVIKPKSCERGTKVVTGLASLLREKP